MAELAEAATCVLLRDGRSGVEALLLRRSAAQRAFPGAWVFPGGQVDPADRVRPEAARRAAVRETREESGIELEEDTLVPWSCWTPPAQAPRRFRTWFFLAEAPPGQAARVDGRESVEHAWLTPAAALARHAAGDMVLLPPTWTTLGELSGHRSAAGILNAARARPPAIFTSALSRDERGRFLLVTAEGGAPYRLRLDGLPWRREAAGEAPPPP
ncbi:NUDIX hydrolase [Thermocatellispora tengchongensis]|uniref:NUDIX hydrolase n=1 Tax=Thermocatellispora tengchongensis TaxID=1073253 RepID=UPI00362BF640